jgi:GNAT superfamily N-acetyltransferase
MSTQSLRLVREPFDGPAALALTAAAVAESRRTYGEPSSEEPPQPEEFVPPKGVFVVAYRGDEAVGCGGLKRLGDDVVELKRMFVPPAARGDGIGRALLVRLEEEAAALGCPTIRLETGTLQHAALALYESAGYERIPCWGAFATDPKSICLQKRL